MLHPSMLSMNYRDILVYHSPSLWPNRRISAPRISGISSISTFSSLWTLTPPSSLTLVFLCCFLSAFTFSFPLTWERLDVCMSHLVLGSFTALKELISPGLASGIYLSCWPRDLCWAAAAVYGGGFFSGDAGRGVGSQDLSSQARTQ